jgi:hypothetical protein
MHKPSKLMVASSPILGSIESKKNCQRHIKEEFSRKWRATVAGCPNSNGRSDEVRILPAIAEDRRWCLELEKHGGGKPVLTHLKLVSHTANDNSAGMSWSRHPLQYPRSSSSQTSRRRIRMLQRSARRSRAITFPNPRLANFPATAPDSHTYRDDGRASIFSRGALSAGSSRYAGAGSLQVLDGSRDIEVPDHNRNLTVLSFLQSFDG